MRGRLKEQKQQLPHGRRVKWTRITTPSWEEREMNKNSNFCIRGKKNEEKQELLHYKEDEMDGKESEKTIKTLHGRKVK